MKKEFKIGLLIIVSIGILVFGYYFLKGMKVFGEDFRIYAEFSRNEGLIESSPLTINGFPVGKVQSMDLIRKDTSYTVLVTFLLEKEIGIPGNSIAKMVSQDLIGNKAVAIVPGDSKDMLKNGDTLRSGIQPTLLNAVPALLHPVKEKVTSLVGNMDSIVVVVNQVMNKDVRKNMLETFAGMKSTVVKLADVTKKINEGVTRNQPKVSSALADINSIAKNIQNNNEAITSIINNLQNITDTVVRKNIRTTIMNANAALVQANAVLTPMATGEGTLGKAVKDPAIFSNLNKAARNMDSLLKDVRYNPERYFHFSVIGGRKK